MALEFINEETIYSEDSFPSREGLLDIIEDIKTLYYLKEIKRGILKSIINKEQRYIVSLSEFNAESWTLNKVIKILKSKGYWITETNESITILW